MWNDIFLLGLLFLSKYFLSVLCSTRQSHNTFYQSSYSPAGLAYTSGGAVEPSCRCQLGAVSFPVVMTRACRDQKILSTYCQRYSKGTLENSRQSIGYEDSNGSVALEKIINISHFKCPLLQIEHLPAYRE